MLDIYQIVGMIIGFIAMGYIGFLMIRSIYRDLTEEEEEEVKNCKFYKRFYYRLKSYFVNVER